MSATLGFDCGLVTAGQSGGGLPDRFYLMGISNTYIFSSSPRPETPVPTCEKHVNYIYLSFGQNTAQTAGFYPLK